MPLSNCEEMMKELVSHVPGFEKYSKNKPCLRVVPEHPSRVSSHHLGYCSSSSQLVAEIGLLPGVALSPDSSL